MKLDKILKFIAIFLMICLVVVVISAGIAIYMNKPTLELEAKRVVSIKKGENLSAIADRLEEEKVIRSAILFKAICIIQNSSTKMKAGFYKIPAYSSTIDIYNIIVSGQQQESKITIPEGWSLLTIAKYLQEKKITSKAAFLEAAQSTEILSKYQLIGKTVEGYLFPDTYYFPEGIDPVIIIEQMINNFYNKIEEILPDYKKIPANEFNDKIIIASIIEREYRVEEEAPLMASVFYNRINYKIGLESCATLEYIITDILGKPHPEYITLEDKKLDSKYNTYKWRGMPPGPISNPGKIALKAAFYPAETDYFYFLVKDPKAGKHYFSKDLEEHVAAKYFYLKGVGSPP